MHEASCHQLKSLYRTRTYHPFDCYTATSLLAQTTDANGLVTVTVMITHRLIATEQYANNQPANKRVTTYRYCGAKQHLLESTLPNGHTPHYYHDDAERLVAVNDQLGYRIQYDYDAQGNV